MSVDIKNISFAYGKKSPLERIIFDKASIRAEQGKFIAIIGNNGAGKSTLAKIIAGEIEIQSGKIIIDKQDCTKLKDFQRSKLISRVFQDPRKGTADSLTVLENLLFASKRDLSRSLVPSIKNDSRAFFKKMLSDFDTGLEKKIDEPTIMLSGGQRQLLSLIMAVSRPSKLLLLDEHTAALAPKTAKMVMELTNTFVKEKGLTTIMITHDMDHLKYCDEIYAVTNYKIVKKTLDTI